MNTAQNTKTSAVTCSRCQQEAGVIAPPGSSGLCRRHAIQWYKNLGFEREAEELKLKPQGYFAPDMLQRQLTASLRTDLKMKTLIQEADELLPVPPENEPVQQPEPNLFSDESIEALESGIKYGTEIGRDWNNLLTAVARISRTMRDFKDEFADSRHGPLPNIAQAQRQLAEVMRICQQVKPVILGMSQIEWKDMY